MIIDKAMRLASAEAITSATKYSTNFVDLTKTAGLKSFSELYLVVKVDGTAFAGGTSIEFQLITTSAAPSDEAGSGLGSVTVEASSGAIATASLTANTIVWKLKMPDAVARRYLGIKAINTGTFSAGTFSAFFTPQYPTEL